MLADTAENNLVSALSRVGLASAISEGFLTEFIEKLTDTDTGANAPTLELGTVTLGEKADVIMRGTPRNRIIDFVLETGPAGEDGEDGADGITPTLRMGTVTQGDTTSAELIRTGNIYTLNMVLEKGVKGEKGDMGPAPALSIGTVTQGSAAAQLVPNGTGAYKLDMTLPKGDNGTSPNLSVGTVDRGTNPAASVSGTFPNLKLNFTLPELPVTTSQTVDSPNDVRTNVLTKNYFGRHLTDTLTTDHTTGIIMELESDFVSFRIGIHNAADTTVTNVKACVALRDQIEYNREDAQWAGEYTMSGGTWIDCTFNGAATATLPPRLGPERTSITWSDPINVKSLARIDGGIRPVIMMRVEMPNGSIMSKPANGISNWRMTTSPRYFKASKVNALAVTDKNAWGSQLANTEIGVICPAVQYVTRKAGRQILIVGDSIMEGINGNPNCVGAAQTVVFRNSTPDNPIDYFNGAIHAQPPLTYAPRVGDLLDVIYPTQLVYGPWSGNDVAPGGMKPDGLERARQALQIVARAVRGYKHPLDVVLTEGTPTNPNIDSSKKTGTNDQIRVDYNTWISGNTLFRPTPTYASSLVSGMLDGQQLLNPSYTVDGTHMNKLGYGVAADQLEPGMKKGWLIGSNVGPKGDKGDVGSPGADGKAATIRVGTVTSGSAPAVTNSGNNTDAVFNFTLQKGDKGDKGDAGSAAPAGISNWYREKIQTVTPGSPVVIANGGYIKTTATGAHSWTFDTTGLETGYITSWTFELTNGGVGTQTFTGVKWPGGVQPTLTTTGTDLLVFTYDGTNLRGVLAVGDSK